MLANAYGAYGDSIAEHILTTTLMAMKRMPEYFEMQKEQGWILLNNIDRFEGSKILSVGMGAIGTAFLRKAAALGAICYGVRRTIHDHPLWTAPRAYLTPHISGGYRAGVNYERVIDVVIENLSRVLEGQRPIHVVDRNLGY